MTSQKSLNNRFTRRLNEIIDSNIQNERFGVSELASKMIMSRTTLHRKIKSKTGQSASHYIRNARLNKALELLKNESLTVAEAAYMAGFRDASYFSKCFRKYFGYPPVETKKKTFDESEFDEQKGYDVRKEVRNRLNNFPVQTTSFIGREKEIQTIIGLIEKHRIITLTGTGGCGKTRLACEVVAQLDQDYPDGIWFVDLAPVEVEELVIKQLMIAFGLPEEPGKNLIDIVIDRIRGKKLLILLDNCEHLIKTCTFITHKLIESIPGLSLLATSRETLKIKGEKVWLIPSLSLPDPAVVIDLEQVKMSEAVCLFSDRARLINSGFELVENNASTITTICRQLDGIPLAIELVAGRIRHMDTKTLLERLSEKFNILPSLDQSIVDRHKTIQAAIEWSYNLLSEEEKALFRQLSVFSGGFDLNAAEEVSANEMLPKERILDLLSQLVEKSMIQTVYQPGHQMRYKLLETLQRYASNLLVEKDEVADTRKRHLEYYTRMAEKAYQEQFESSALWLPKLKQENDNLIGALNWADQNYPDGFRLLAGYLSWYWVIASDLISGKQYLGKALNISSEETEAYARNLYGLGYLTFYFKDIGTVLKLLNDSRSLWHRLKNPFEEAIVLCVLSMCYQQLKDFRKSFKCSERSLDLAREVGKPGLINNALLYLCMAMVHSRQFTEALPYVDELLASSENLNHTLGMCGAHHLHSDCALGLKDFAMAEKSYGLATQTATKFGVFFNSYADLQGVAFALSGQRRWAKSIRLNAAAVAGFESIGVEIYGIWPLWDEFIETYINKAKEAVGEEQAKQYEEEGIAMGFDRAMEYALDFKKD